MSRGSQKPLIVISGPTAVGKSRVAMSVAQALNTEILTADSRQVYKGMDIGVDKPTTVDQRTVPHRLIDLVEPSEHFDVGRYRRLALKEIARLQDEHRLPLLVGGTGLYIRAVLRGLWEAPAVDWAYRHALMEVSRREGRAALHRQLSAVDPELAARLHPHDELKVIRGLEAFHSSGRPLSVHHREHASGDQPFTALLIVLTRDRSSLYRRVEARVDAQIAHGLVTETARLLDAGYRRDLGAMKGLGYRQIAGHLAGEYSLDHAVKLLKRDTRHYAKRQLTWFRKEPTAVWIDMGSHQSSNAVAGTVLRLVRSFVATLADPTPWEDAVRFSVSA